MKTVFSSHAECIHRFMQFDQSTGRAGNVFFSNKVLYSYGYHFELARLLSDGSLLLNTRSYSKSTSKHQGVTRGAVNPAKVKRTVFLEWQKDFDFEACFRLHVKEANLTYSAWNNSGRKVFRSLDPLFKSVENLRALESIQSIDWGALTFDLNELREIYYERSRAQDLITRKAAETRETAKQRTEAENLALWIKGLYNGNFYHTQKIYLRRKGENIESSKGAKVPLLEAVNMVQDIRNGVDVTGKKIGTYTVNSITLDYITIGCHVISFETVNELFK
jgi:hypothetical protein